MAATLDILREYVAAATSQAVQPEVARQCAQLLPRLHAALPGTLHVEAWDPETIRLLLSLLRFHTVMLQQCKVPFSNFLVQNPKQLIFVVQRKESVILTFTHPPAKRITGSGMLRGAVL